MEHVVLHMKTLEPQRHRGTDGISALGFVRAGGVGVARHGGAEIPSSIWNDLEQLFEHMSTHYLLICIFIMSF